MVVLLWFVLLKKIEGLKGDNDDQNVGIGMLLKAATAPLRQIVSNAGEEASVVCDKVRAGKGNSVSTQRLANTAT